MSLLLGFAEKIATKRKEKKLNKLIDNRPEYDINEEAYENQNIARSEAFGRDRSIQMQDEQLEQNLSDAVSDVKDVTPSTSGLLSAIQSIYTNNNSARRDLATNEAALQNDKKTRLMGVNQQMIDEKDKEWNYNTNMPYQMKVAALRDKIKFGQEQQAQQFAAASNFFTSMFAGGQFNYGGGGGGGNSGGGGGGMMGGMALSDERTKKDVADINHGLDAVMSLRPVEFKYKWENENHLGFIAQDVQKVLPDVVKMDEDTPQEYLKINLQEIIPVLVKAVQEQQLQIHSLKKEIASFKVTA